MNSSEASEGGSGTPARHGATPEVAGTATPTPAASARAARIAAAIERIWSERAGAVLDQIDIIEEGVTELLGGHLGPALREPAQREAHKLAGSLGTFGFPLGSSIAREMEAILSRGPSLDNGDALRLSELLVQLRKEVGRSPSKAVSVRGAE